MIIALNKEKERVNIELTNTSDEYFCPICGEKLIIKKGSIRAHHFAHARNCACQDEWHYEMSPWHHSWQNRFPIETQEIVKVSATEKHRADVLIEDRKLVYEFQHSKMSSEEFKSRNSFYNSLGYKVIWVFDVSMHVENDLLSSSFIFGINNTFFWKRPFETFSSFSTENKNVELYFQVANDANDDEAIIEAKRRLKKGYVLDYDDKFYYEKHRYDRPELIKIKWWSTNFRQFVTDGKVYHPEDIVNLSNFKEEVIEDDKYETDEPETICNLWIKYNLTKGTFLNTMTRNIVKIVSNPLDQFYKYNKVYGYVGIQNSTDSREIYSWRNKQWKLLNKY